MKNLLSLGLRVDRDHLYVLDQQNIPHREDWILCESPAHMVNLIKALKIRGAPLIGVGAAVSLALYSQGTSDPEKIKKAAQALRDSRPTAVNLMAAMDRMVFNKPPSDWTASTLVPLAEHIFEEDVQLCEKMADHGEPLINAGDNILTHCNTGGLATVGIGTALGVIRRAHERGKKIHVYVDETRPLLQGGRLTTWELQKLGVPFTLICDNMAATLMRAGRIQKVFLGSDRIATNGDFANKVGTYSVAVNANHHKVPFYPVAPYTTLDLNCPSGSQIPIEDRHAEEVRGAFVGEKNLRWAPETCDTFNPSFDVTPVELVTGIVMDTAYYSREELLKCALKKGAR